MKKRLVEIFEKIRYKDSIGIDGIGADKYAEKLEEELEIIERKIQNQTYEFSFYRQKKVMKSPGNFREISIPTIRDKIVLGHLNLILKQYFKKELSYDRTASEISKELIHVRKSYECFIKIDVQDFFPSINHEQLMKLIAANMNDAPNTVDMLRKAITQTTVAMNTPKSLRVAYNNSKGIPQGLSISGTLASIYIASIIQKYACRTDLKIYKFVDDLLILCDEKAVESILSDLDIEFTAKYLTLHRCDATSDKSSIGRTYERFEYLGYIFNGETITVREKSVQKILKSLIHLFTQYKYGTLNMNELCNSVNTKITGGTTRRKKYGWIHYYSMINDEALLKKLDHVVAQQCKKAGIVYDAKFKKFSRAYFEIKKDESRYIPKLDGFSQVQQYAMIAELENDVRIY